jgi:hypothetical protein
MATISWPCAYAHNPFLQKFRFVLVWLAQGIGIVNELVDWLLAPVRGFFRVLVGIFKSSESTAA